MDITLELVGGLSAAVTTVAAIIGGVWKAMGASFEKRLDSMNHHFEKSTESMTHHFEESMKATTERMEKNIGKLFDFAEDQMVSQATVNVKLKNLETLVKGKA